MESDRAPSNVRWSPWYVYLFWIRSHTQVDLVGVRWASNKPPTSWNEVQVWLQESNRGPIILRPNPIICVKTFRMRSDYHWTPRKGINLPYRIPTGLVMSHIEDVASPIGIINHLMLVHIFRSGNRLDSDRHPNLIELPIGFPMESGLTCKNPRNFR